MLLAVDVGNTNVVFALCEGESIRAQWRIRTDIHRTADEYAVWLFTLMGQAGITASQVTGAIVSSVVPDANFSIKTFIRSHMKCDPRMVTTGELALDMPVKIDNPRELGADRLVNAYAAWSERRCGLIVIDFGTATTFDVVSAAGEYIGGVIAPGINLSLEALQKAAAKLHGVAITHPEHVIGKNTTAAMQAGIYFGYAGLIEGIVKRINSECCQPMKVIATGGLAPLFAQATAMIDAVDSDLTIRGLMRIHTQKEHV